LVSSTAKPRKGGKRYRVFISHAGEDLWVARQLAAAAEAAGATTFLDAYLEALSKRAKKR
jgi:hypothetical protein